MIDEEFVMDIEFSNFINCCRDTEKVFIRFVLNGHALLASRADGPLHSVATWGASAGQQLWDNSDALVWQHEDVDYACHICGERKEVDIVYFRNYSPEEIRAHMDREYPGSVKWDMKPATNLTWSAYIVGWDEMGDCYMLGWGSEADPLFDDDLWRDL